MMLPMETGYELLSLRPGGDARRACLVQKPIEEKDCYYWTIRQPANARQWRMGDGTYLWHSRAASDVLRHDSPLCQADQDGGVDTREFLPLWRDKFEYYYNSIDDDNARRRIYYPPRHDLNTQAGFDQAFYDCIRCLLSTNPN